VSVVAVLPSVLVVLAAVELPEPPQAAREQHHAGSQHEGCELFHVS